MVVLVLPLSDGFLMYLVSLVKIVCFVSSVNIVFTKEIATDIR